MFLGNELSSVLHLDDHLAVCPQWIGRTQLEHHAAVQRQTVGHLDAD